MRMAFKRWVGFSLHRVEVFAQGKTLTATYFVDGKRTRTDTRTGITDLEPVISALRDDLEAQGYKKVIDG